MVGATSTTSFYPNQSTDLQWQLHRCSSGIQQTRNALTRISTAVPESLLLKPWVCDGDTTTRCHNDVAWIPKPAESVRTVRLSD